MNRLTHNTQGVAVNISSSITVNPSNVQCEHASDDFPSPDSIGRTIKDLRKKLGASQREFAQQVNVDFMWLSRIENDRQSIDDATENAVALILPKLAQMAEVNLEWLKRLPIVYHKPSEQPAFVDRAKSFR